VEFVTSRVAHGNVRLATETGFRPQLRAAARESEGEHQRSAFNNWYPRAARMRGNAANYSAAHAHGQWRSSW